MSRKSFNCSQLIPFRALIGCKQSIKNQSTWTRIQGARKRFSNSQSHNTRKVLVFFNLFYFEYLLFEVAKEHDKSKQKWDMEEQMSRREIEALFREVKEEADKQAKNLSAQIKKLEQQLKTAIQSIPSPPSDKRHVFNFIVLCTLIAVAIVAAIKKRHSQNADDPLLVGVIVTIIKNFVDVCPSIAPICALIWICLEFFWECFAVCRRSNQVQQDPDPNPNPEPPSAPRNFQISDAIENNIDLHADLERVVLPH